MIWNLLTFLGLSGFAIYFLTNSGVDPSAVNLEYEVGIALATGAAVSLLTTMLSRNPNREILQKLDEMQGSLRVMQEQLDELE